MLDLYRHYRNAVLYQAGGVIDQPALYTEAMLVIQRAEMNSKAGSARGNVQH